MEERERRIAQRHHAREMDNSPFQSPQRSSDSGTFKQEVVKKKVLPVLSHKKIYFMNDFFPRK